MTEPQSECLVSPSFTVNIFAADYIYELLGAIISYTFANGRLFAVYLVSSTSLCVFPEGL